MRREQYVGVWLPEPLVDEESAFSPGPEAINEYAQDVSIAFMLALERLSPLERAAFLLHDVFDLDFDEIAQRLSRTAAACRQLAARARQHVRSAEVRNEVSDVDASRLLQVFGRPSRRAMWKAWLRRSPRTWNSSPMAAAASRSAQAAARRGADRPSLVASAKRPAGASFAPSRRASMAGRAS